MKERVIDAFLQQAEACAALGSPFTGRICGLFARHMRWNSPVGEVLASWSGDPRAMGDNVPLRLAGALNALVLSGEAAELIAVYPPNHTQCDDPTLWKAISEALITHSAFVIERLKLPPQTNELRRSAVLLPAFLTVARTFEKPLRLSEIGSSSGLNLLWDQYSYRLGDQDWGASDSAIRLMPDWQGPSPAMGEITVNDRAGCDLNPLDLLDPNERLQALSYIWPDQTERVKRTISAMDLFRKFRPKVERSHALPWLERRLATPQNDCVHVVFHSIVVQYFSPEDKSALTERMALAGQRASARAPLAWIQYEADDQDEGAGVTLTTWPDGAQRQLARADFHGRWVNWSG